MALQFVLRPVRMRKAQPGDSQAYAGEVEVSNHLQLPGRAHPTETLDLERMNSFGFSRLDVVHAGNIIPPVSKTFGCSIGAATSAPRSSNRYGLP